MNDFAVGKRCKLEMINIFTDEGKINENGGKFAGMQRFDARKAVLEELKTLGLYKETKDNKMVLPICGRSGNIVEPLLKPQWYIRCDEMFKEACDAVTNGDLEIRPELSEREWFKWLGNPQDWCISRQLWWGHRIPAYLISIKGESMDVRRLMFNCIVDQRRCVGLWSHL
jgi:valyl-tRNA synthetase